MNSVKLNQIVNKVNVLLGGADDCFNEEAGYIIYTDEKLTHKLIKVNTFTYGEKQDRFELTVFKKGGFSVTRQGLDEDQVIELLNK